VKSLAALCRGECRAWAWQQRRQPRGASWWPPSEPVGLSELNNV
jgi:hypothetical protein